MAGDTAIDVDGTTAEGVEPTLPGGLSVYDADVEGIDTEETCGMTDDG